MAVGHTFVIFLLTYYTSYLTKIIFNKKHRHNVQKSHKHLEVMREQQIRSVKEQLEFVNTKYPKVWGEFKWSWSTIPKLLLNVTLFIALFRGYYYLFDIWGLSFNIWQSILFVILFPIGINIILKRFNIQKGDISVYWK